MSFNPDDYDISIRSLEPTYNHTLPRDTKRKDTEHETHLAKIAVEVHLRAGRSTSEDYDETFVAVFTVDHDPGSVAFRSVGSKFDTTAFDPEKFWYVSHFAGDVVADWLDSVGLDYQPPAQSVTMWDEPPAPTVHTDMLVAPEGKQ
jgi:hypothetical protein